MLVFGDKKRIFVVKQVFRINIEDVGFGLSSASFKVLENFKFCVCSWKPWLFL